MKNRMYTDKNRRGRTLLSITKSMIMMVVGALISIPFIYDVLTEAGHHYLEWGAVFKFVAFLIGSPLSLVGFVTILTPNSQWKSKSTTDMDVARIRFTVENDARNKK